MSTQAHRNSASTLTPGSQSTLGSVDPVVAEKGIVHTEAGVVSGDSDVESFQEKEGNIVHWDGDDDPQNPMNWSPFRKWLTIGLISVSSFNVYVPLRSQSNQLNTMLTATFQIYGLNRLRTGRTPSRERVQLKQPSPLIAYGFYLRDGLRNWTYLLDTSFRSLRKTTPDTCGKHPVHDRCDCLRCGC